LITISFHDQDLHDTCARLDAAEDRYGSVHAQAIVTFISEAYSSENAEELLGLYGNRAQVGLDDSLSIEISSRYLATLVPVGTRFKKDDGDRVIWNTVNRLKIMQIVRRA